MDASAIDKQSLMWRLRKQAEAYALLTCRPGSELVWGEGPLDSRLAFVGEAPGKHETLLGRPFVGLAGKFFRAEIARAGIDVSAAWITNTVKCRPVRESCRASCSSSRSRRCATWT